MHLEARSNTRATVHMLCICTHCQAHTKAVNVLLAVKAPTVSTFFSRDKKLTAVACGWLALTTSTGPALHQESTSTSTFSAIEEPKKGRRDGDVFPLTILMYHMGQHCNGSTPPTAGETLSSCVPIIHRIRNL